MYTAIRFILILICCTSLSTNSFADMAVIRMSDGKAVSFSQMVTDTASSDVIFFAETHDRKNDHELQLDAIRSLQAKKLPVAIGLEMFQTDNQKQLDDWVAGKIPEYHFKETYAANWSYDWSLYRDIFIFARDNHIPMIALNVPKAIVMKVAKQGFASLTPEERNELPAEVSCELNAPQTEFMKKTFLEVFKHDTGGRRFSNFCEAQGLRNSGMARIIASDHSLHPGRKLVVLAGTWHAVKHGIPERLTNIDGLKYKVILPEIPELGRRNVSPTTIDYLIER